MGSAAYRRFFMIRRDAWFSSSSALRGVLLVPLLALGVACGGHTNGGDSGQGDGATNGDGSHLDGSVLPDGAPANDGTNIDAPVNDGGPVQVSDAGVTVHDPDGGTWTCYPTTCASHLLQCGDCIDNDGDGLIDEHDPDCLGPCSNSEANLFGSVGGGTSSACNLNCYFNFGQGRGSGCSWDHSCDPLTPVAGCAYVPPASRNAGLNMACPDQQSAACLSSCEPLTPNGCDCFGCCQFGTQFLYLGSRDSSGTPTCTIDAARAGDTTACHACTPVRDPTTHQFSCGNECSPCEVCIDGHMPDPSCYTTPDAATPTDVPPGTDAGPPPGMQCPTGIQPCGLPGQSPCAFGFYCITGCCEAAPG
jgi:hypothetical protein